MAYHLTMSDGGIGKETIEIEAEDLDEARDQAIDELRDWIRGGEWGDEGASVDAGWTLADEDGEELESGSLTVPVKPNHEALIRRAGGDPACDHDWTSEGEGGCKENPGVWSRGGTKLSFESHCRTCGLHRLAISLGSQHNPGESDTVEYQQPKTWCEECQSEECKCDEDDD